MIALACDAADGYIARLDKGRQSLIGADLDSLADIVSFGVAPAVLGYTLGLRGLWDVVCLTWFVCCGISRLARFNVTSASLTNAATGESALLRRHADSDERGPGPDAGCPLPAGADGQTFWLGRWELLDSARFTHSRRFRAPQTASRTCRASGRSATRAAYDLQDHAAKLRMPAGKGVVEGDEIPYQPWAAAKKLENFTNRATADPLAQCYHARRAADHVSGFSVSDFSDAATTSR